MGEHGWFIGSYKSRIYVFSQCFKNINTDDAVFSYKDHLTTLLKAETTLKTFSLQLKELENNEFFSKVQLL